MKTPVSFTQYRHHALAMMLALAASFGLMAPGSASANSTKDTTIINVATVAYTDMAGVGSWSAHAASKVTVNLVAAAPSLYNAPSGGGSPGSADCPPSAFDSFASGSTVSRVYALAAQANGWDTYDLSVTNYATGTVSTVSITRTVSTLKTDGTGTSAITGIDAASAASRDLGSAIPIGFTAPNILHFPGGSLTNQKLDIGDIVLVQVGASKKLFQITNKDNGTAPNHGYADGGPHTDTLGAVDLEAIGTLTLGPLPDATLYGQIFGGGNASPAFGTTAPTTGVPVGEVVFLKVDITASTSVRTSGTPATAGFTFSTEDPTPKTCAVGNFLAPTLNITKEVRRYNRAATSWGSFAGTATGNPGDWLEYQVTVSNSGVQAGSVSVSDAVPTYTTLITGASDYGSVDGSGDPDGTGVAGHFFATITSYNDAATPAAVQTAKVKMVTDATQPSSPLAKVGFGNANGIDPTGSAIAFYLGDSSTNSAGGKLPACSDTTYTTEASCKGATPAKDWITSYKILYRVKIN